MTIGILTLTAVLAPASAAAASSSVVMATQLADRAVEVAARDPEAAWAIAREALDASARFDPTELARPGRHGEIVEDVYREARRAYRAHRAAVYLAAGRVMAARGRLLPASRYLRRAQALDASIDPVPLARVLLADGRAWDALDVALSGIVDQDRPAREAQEVLGLIADALGLPSAQAEIDRRRAGSASDGTLLEWVQTPIDLPMRARLSTGHRVSFREDQALRIVYVADEGCATCTADLELLGRLVPANVEVIVASQGDDRVLRQAMRLYRRDWPVLLGEGAAAALPVRAPAVLAVARGGWSAAIARRPLDVSLPRLLDLLAREDVREIVPRARWNGAPPSRPPAAGAGQPDWTAGDLAPGEDLPWPDELVRAARSYREGRPAEALVLIGELEQRDDGWLLGPEARLNRALCLAAQGRLREARRLARGIGDSRFQDEIDAWLETSAPAAGGRR